MNKEANNKVSCLDKKQINGPQLQFFFTSFPRLRKNIQLFRIYYYSLYSVYAHLAEKGAIDIG